MRKWIYLFIEPCFELKLCSSCLLVISLSSDCAEFVLFFFALYFVSSLLQLSCLVFELHAAEFGTCKVESRGMVVTV